MRQSYVTNSRSNWSSWKGKDRRKYSKISGWQFSKFDKHYEYIYQRDLTKSKHKTYIKKTMPWNLSTNYLKPVIRRKMLEATRGNIYMQKHKYMMTADLWKATKEKG